MRTRCLSQRTTQMRNIENNRSGSAFFSTSVEAHDNREGTAFRWHFGRHTGLQDRILADVTFPQYNRVKTADNLRGGRRHKRSPGDSGGLIAVTPIAGSFSFQLEGAGHHRLTNEQKLGRGPRAMRVEALQQSATL